MKSKSVSSFSFQLVLIDSVKDIIKTLNTKKASPDNVISVKHLKMNQDIFSRLTFQNFNQSLVNGEFTQCLKQAEVIPVFKKEEKFSEFSYYSIPTVLFHAKIFKKSSKSK